jgi:hypothetical protein
MSKIVAIVFAAVTVLTGSAHAALIGDLIGEGLTSLDVADGDVFYNLGGNGFAAEGVVFSHGFNELSAGMNSFGFDASGSGAVFLLRVGALTCSSVDEPQPSGGECGGGLQLTNTPTPPLDKSAAFDTHSAPFTAIGQVHVGGETFDVVGRGIATETWCLQEPPGLPPFHCVIDGQPFPLFQTVHYGFSVLSVDEPPTLLLVVASFGMLGALFGARVLRDRYAARTHEHP